MTVVQERTASTYSPTWQHHGPPELSVVMPCLNEADTLAVCIEKARRGMLEAGVVGEIIVADNGSTDGSREIARRLDARVVSVGEQGYGAALMGGIAAARGRYIVMGDADDSYDFGELPKFVVKLRAGYELVQGCRLPSGGGTVMPGAMPFLRRWWGNPMFTLLVRRWFGAPIHDVYCGLRAFRRDLYDSLGQRCTGMEFATEMIIRSSLRGARIAEVPITLHPDGRTSHPPHLKTFRDGWRTLRFFLLHCPRWLFLFPGLLLVAVGLGTMAWLLPGARTVAGVTFDYHTLLFAAAAVMLGAQAIQFWVFAKLVAIAEGLLRPDRRLTRLLDLLPLELRIGLGLAVFVMGLGLSVYALSGWSAQSFGPLDPDTSLRLVIPAVLCMVLGMQELLGSFFVSLLGLRRRWGAVLANLTMLPCRFAASLALPFAAPPRSPGRAPPPRRVCRAATRASAPRGRSSPPASVPCCSCSPRTPTRCTTGTTSTTTTTS